MVQFNPSREETEDPFQRKPDLPYTAEYYAAQLEAFRRNVARWLVNDYKKDPFTTASICDEMLDRSGVLLGYVREEARNK